MYVCMVRTSSSLGITNCLSDFLFVAVNVSGKSQQSCKLISENFENTERNKSSFLFESVVTSI